MQSPESLSYQKKDGGAGPRRPSFGMTPTFGKKKSKLKEKKNSKNSKKSVSYQKKERLRTLGAFLRNTAQVLLGINLLFLTTLYPDPIGLSTRSRFTEEI